MLIISADDFGRSRLATDRTIAGFNQGTITAAGMMVFMEDSQRAAELAKEYGIDVGLHLNFTQRVREPQSHPLYLRYHDHLVRYLTANKYRHLFYNHFLRKEFAYVFHVQHEEFERLFGSPPTHIDGHHHMHLSMNMLMGKVIPQGRIVRRNFTYASGEKDLVNRAYRALVDRFLRTRYTTTDFLFCLSERLHMGTLHNDLKLARVSSVELLTHPDNDVELQWLNEHADIHKTVGFEKGNFSVLKPSFTGGGAFKP